MKQDPKGSVEETPRNIEEEPRDAEIAGHGEMVDEGLTLKLSFEFLVQNHDRRLYGQGYLTNDPVLQQPTINAHPTNSRRS